MFKKIVRAPRVPHLGTTGGDDAMAFDDRDRRVLAEIARQVRADDPAFAAAMTGPLPRSEPDWAPIHLRVLAVLLLVAGVLTSVAPLVLAAIAVYGIAQLYRTPGPHPRTAPARGLPTHTGESGHRRHENGPQGDP